MPRVSDSPPLSPRVLGSLPIFVTSLPGKAALALLLEEEEELLVAMRAADPRALDTGTALTTLTGAAEEEEELLEPPWGNPKLKTFGTAPASPAGGRGEEEEDEPI